MSLFISSLNSGSNGNCYYVGTQEEAVLIDGGISCRETERRLKRLELSIKKIKAIFVTHEHSDHVYGVSQLSKKYQLPVYITAGTLRDGRVKLKENLTLPFRSRRKHELQIVNQFFPALSDSGLSDLLFHHPDLLSPFLPIEVTFP
jgi:phosphoribosyl 1,2-cyclic phosphodiesterase